MADEIIEEVWRIKDEIAREHGYDLGKLGAYYLRLELEEVQPEEDGAGAAEKGPTRSDAVSWVDAEFAGRNAGAGALDRPGARPYDGRTRDQQRSGGPRTVGGRS